MKNLKKVFVMLAVVLLSISGMLFGCTDKYKNLSIKTDLDSDTIQLYYRDPKESNEEADPQKPNSKTFVVSVLGAGEGVSTNIKYFLASDLVTVSLTHTKGSADTSVTITAINCGKTTLKFITEEGDKSLTFNIEVIYELKSLKQNTNYDYKPYAIIGRQTKINTAKCITFDPDGTTQKDIVYSGDYADVEVLEDGTIIAGPDAQNGTMTVTAQSRQNPDIYINLDVLIVRPIDAFDVYYGDLALATNKDFLNNERNTLSLSYNMVEESGKNLSITPQPSDNDYTISYQVVEPQLDAQNNFITSSAMSAEAIDTNTVRVTALKSGNAVLKITATLNGFNYDDAEVRADLQTTAYLNLQSTEVPTAVYINGNQNQTTDTIYDVYQNGYGARYQITVGGPNAQNKQFVIAVSDDDVDKITIISGKRDADGNPEEVSYYNGDLSASTIFDNGTTLYISANKDRASDTFESATINFIAVGSVGLLGSEVSNSINAVLKCGVSQIDVQNNIVNGTLLVPIAQTDDDAVSLVLTTASNQQTDAISTNFESTSLKIDKTSVKFADSKLQNNQRQYTFNLQGVREGIYNVTFSAENGVATTVKVRVFAQVTEITASTTLAQQNASIGKVDYKSTQSGLSTLDTLAISKDGNVALSLNSYNGTRQTSCTFVNVRYLFNDPTKTNGVFTGAYEANSYSSNYVKIDSLNNIYGYDSTSASYPVKVTAIITVYDNSSPTTDVKDFEIEFNVTVFVAIKSISMNSETAIIYTKSTLSDYASVDGISDKQKYGEFTFVVTINPTQALKLTTDNISVNWTGRFADSVYRVTSFDKNVYKITVSCDSLDGAETAKVDFSITISQYQQSYVREGTIIIKSASKVKDIYNVKKVQDGNQTLINITDNQGDLYLYFDARNMDMQNGTKFNITAQVNPTDVLNSKFVYLYEAIDNTEEVVNILDDGLVINRVGNCYIYLCSQDSYNGVGLLTDPTSYTKSVKIHIKVADGTSISTALDISTIDDLIGINNNPQSLQMFYTITKDINVISSQWTPIGCINGKVYEFNGYIDGLIGQDDNQSVATISGITLKDSLISGGNLCYGLFAKVGEDAIVKNINIEILSVDIAQDSQNVSAFVGGICGINAGRLENLSVNFVNAGKSALTDANIADKSLSLYVGGIAGQNDGTIVRCFVGGEVNITKQSSDSANYFVGGIAGQNNSLVNGDTSMFNVANVTDSYNSTIQIVIKQQVIPTQSAVGGIVGYNKGQIKNVSASATIKAFDNVGGIVGLDELGTVDNAYFSGSINANASVGGLVGNANQTNITNSSVNMFDSELPTTAISGASKVGGAVGSIIGSNASGMQTGLLQNVYVRSYVKQSRSGFNGDILSTLDNGTYVGGLVGYAVNLTTQKVYSRVAIKANGTAIGGLFGYADNVTTQISFERNTLLGNTKYNGLIFGQQGQNPSTANYFYSSNNSQNATSQNIYYGDGAQPVLQNCANNSNIQDVKNWANLTNSETNLDGNNWYLPSGDTYPYIIFNQSKILTVEPPTSIYVTAQNTTIGSTWLVKLNHTYVQNSTKTDAELDQQLADTYVLFKGKTKTIDFNKLFSVTVLPNNTILNISTDYNIKSSNANIVEILGKSSASYKIRLNSTGKVTLTITSKLNADATATITIYVLNSVQNFALTADKYTVIVGNSQEIKQSISKNYQNNNDFVIKLTKQSPDTSLQNFYINGSNQNPVYVSNSQKIFVSANDPSNLSSLGRSGRLDISYTTYVKLDVDGTDFLVPLMNDNGRELKPVNAKLNTFNFIYGIKDFTCNTVRVETGLNDFAFITYTLLGDDLRYNGTTKLPNIDWTVDKNSLFWNIKLAQVNIYSSLDSDPTALVIDAGNSTGANFNINSYPQYTNYTANDTVVKMEFILRAEVNKANISKNFVEFADQNTIMCNLTFSAQICDTTEGFESDDSIKRSIVSQLVINRQKIDNIGLEFYTNSEKRVDASSDSYIYTVNEVPSKAIITGKDGLLKIAISPNNAEVKNVNVYYSNANGYFMSMRQVLKNTDKDYDDTGSQKQAMYVDRIPYAVAIDNGKGLQLYYNESTYNQTTKTIAYNGYLYVDCIVASSVPAGELFTISVDATYTNNYHYVTNIVIVAKQPSSINLSYDFNGQIVSDYTYIAKGVTKQVVAEFTELSDTQDLSVLLNEFAPNVVFGGASSADNSHAYQVLKNGKVVALIQPLTNTNSIELPTATRQSYRVTYNITTTEVCEFELQGKLTKTVNNIQTTYASNVLKFNSVNYVITNLSINDGGNNTFTITQTSPRPLAVSISYQFDEAMESQKKEKMEQNISTLANNIACNLNYWFGARLNSNKYEALDADTDYGNYTVYYTAKQTIRIGVKQLDTASKLYVQVPFAYANGIPSLATSLSKQVGDTNNGIVAKIGAGNLPIYYQNIIDDVTLKLTKNVSDENPIPIDSAEKFINMQNGAEEVDEQTGETTTKIINYALDSDIVLDRYDPRDLQYISLDGNMHTITINSFIRRTGDGDAVTYNSEFGLFNTIDANSTLKNVNICYTGLVSVDGQNLTTMDTTEWDISNFSFGGACVSNAGVIYNVNVTGNSQLEFKNDISKSALIAGFVATNTGYISFGKSSLTFTANCGNVAGFVAVNSKKISNSKVVISGSIKNTLTTTDNTITAGFVTKNTGSIFGSYVSGQNSNTDGIIDSLASVGGFANQNAGEISNCFSSITVNSTTRSSGFVYNNSGSITSSYANCVIETSSTVHTPFTGTDEKNNYINTGSIQDCYYIGSFDAYKSINGEFATRLNSNDFDTTDTAPSAFKKSSYAKFNFATDVYNGVWSLKDANSLPTLVDANLNIVSKQVYDGIKVDADGISYYSWKFEDSPDYGKSYVSNSQLVVNPRVISTIEQWNAVIGNMQTQQEDKTDVVSIVKDIVASTNQTPATSDGAFSGTLLGNNMSITNLYIRGDSSQGKTFGLFAVLDGATIKNLSLSAKQVISTNANSVGVLAGYINNSQITNILISADDVVVQGKNAVGMLAGIINNSNVSFVTTTGSVNAGYREANTSLYNYLKESYFVKRDAETNEVISSNKVTDLAVLTDDSKNYDVPYSYAGIVAGMILGQSNVTCVSVSGENKVIGYYVGLVAGLVDTDSILSLASAQIQQDQYVRGFAVAGGLVGENRGILDRCFIQYPTELQSLIDSNTTNTYLTNRNLEFFKGSPKFIGGLVGFNNGGKIINCYTSLDVRTTSYNTYASGGLVGLDVAGLIKGCYATGSVTNKYVIGGLIGVVTNRETLLGYTIQNIGENAKRNDENQIFATNYYYNVDNAECWDKYIRPAYIVVSGEPNSIYISSIQDEYLEMNNNVASNKWLLNQNSTGLTDIGIINNATSGLMIGLAFDHQAKNVNLKNITDKTYFGYSDIVLNHLFKDNMFNSSLNFVDNKNYVNTQVLKQTTSQTPITPANIQLSEILSAFIQNANADLQAEQLVDAINNATIGAYGMQVSLSSSAQPNIATNIASCTANGALVSFENLLNLDDTLLDSQNGLFAGFSNLAYNLPNKQVSLSMYYPQIIVNVNCVITGTGNNLDYQNN